LTEVTSSVANASADDPSGAGGRRGGVLEALGLVKSYGHVTALAGVNLTLLPHEIVALVGDNGAGKTTLVSCLAGLIQPDEGEIRLHGHAVTIATPARAQQLGIATIFQNLALVGQRDVASNIFAGREPSRLGIFVDRRRMVREAAAMIADLRVNIPSVRARVDELSGGQRQATAVVRALMGENSVTLMDEPTAALGVREAARVLELAERLRNSGQAVLLISHNMESVFSLADRIVVLRHGRRVLDRRREETSREEVVSLLTGAVVREDT
jgi:ABC-type sugar transport system ATPase subunit